MVRDASFAQNANGDLTMWRDWGLIEAHFSRWRAGARWNVDFLMLQTHRMKKPPRWKPLRRELAAHRHEISADGVVEASNARANVSDAPDCPRLLGRAVKIHVPAAPFPHRRSPQLTAAGKHGSAFVDAREAEVSAVAGDPDEWAG